MAAPRGRRPRVLERDALSPVEDGDRPARAGLVLQAQAVHHARRGLPC